MRCVILAGLALLVAFDRLTAQEPPTPAERYQALAEAHTRGEREWSTAYAAAKTPAERAGVLRDVRLRVLALARTYAFDVFTIARDHPADPAAFDALNWLLKHVPDAPETDEAVAALTKQERLQYTCSALVGDGRPAARKLLRAAMAGSPHAAVQGYARFALAVTLAHEADGLAMHGDAAKQCDPLRAEADKLFAEVVAKHADREMYPKRPLGPVAAAELYALRNLSVGMTVPEIDGTDLDGNKLKLSEFRGKVTLLAFTATWCAPCMAQVPREVELVKKYAGKPFEIVAVNGDADPKAAAKVYADKGATWRAFRDGAGGNGPIATKWGVTVWPTLYLIDAKGVIRYKGHYLSAVSFKAGKDGQVEEERMLEPAVAGLMKELEPKGP